MFISLSFIMVHSNTILVERKMKVLLLIVLTIFSQTNHGTAAAKFGNVFPIPLAMDNDDPEFKVCPEESGAYTHSTNCSLFHMCTFGVHTIYSCIDEYFYNPKTGKCHYWKVKDYIDCEKILERITISDVIPLDNSLKGLDRGPRRKSDTSPCTETGIFPDIFDCSLFHYCRVSRRHETHQCPNGRSFDPKIFMCSAPQLVDCQYEPTSMTEDVESESTTSLSLDDICHDLAVGTHLPVPDKDDEYIVCDKTGKIEMETCPFGSVYNAGTETCEKKPCRFNSTLCQNDGQCVDELDHPNGFKCICPLEFRGEFCEKLTERDESTTELASTSTRNLLQLFNRHTIGQKIMTARSPTEETPASAQTSSTKVSTEVADVPSPRGNVSTKSSSWLLFSYWRVKKPYPTQRYTNSMNVAYAMILLFIGLPIFISMSFFLVFCVQTVLLTSSKKLDQPAMNIEVIKS